MLSELEKVLDWDIDDNIKIKLLELTEDAISVIGLKCSPAITRHILTNNLDANDLPALFSSYDQWRDDVQQIIFKKATVSISNIVTDSTDISKSLLKQLIYSTSLAFEDKIDLLARFLSQLTQKECEDIFDILQLPSEYKKIYDKAKRPSFEINDTNQKLLSAFVKSEIIYSFKEDSNREGYYKIRRTKPILEVLPAELL